MERVAITLTVGDAEALFGILRVEGGRLKRLSATDLTPLARSVIERQEAETERIVAAVRTALGLQTACGVAA